MPNLAMHLIHPGRQLETVCYLRRRVTSDNKSDITFATVTISKVNCKKCLPKLWLVKHGTAFDA